MMTVNQTAHFGRGLELTINGGFRINGTSDPDNKRSGNSGFFTVARESAGLFTVTIDSDAGTLPEKTTKEWAGLSETVAPTAHFKAYVVKDSYSKVTRSFQIQVVKVAADGADGGTDPDVAAADPADNDMVFFELKGHIDSIGTDNVT